jgi:hypothetical protein
LLKLIVLLQFIVFFKFLNNASLVNQLIMMVHSGHTWLPLLSLLLLLLHLVALLLVDQGLSVVGHRLLAVLLLLEDKILHLLRGHLLHLGIG